MWCNFITLRWKLYHKLNTQSFSLSQATASMMPKVNPFLACWPPSLLHSPVVPSSSTSTSLSTASRLSRPACSLSVTSPSSCSAITSWSACLEKCAAWWPCAVSACWEINYRLYLHSLVFCMRSRSWTCPLTSWRVYPMSSACWKTYTRWSSRPTGFESCPRHWVREGESGAMRKWKSDLDVQWRMNPELWFLNFFFFISSALKYKNITR